MNSTAISPDKPSIPGHELLGRIGAGSYGEVWMARNAWGKLRAVKVVRRETFGHNLRHFEREYDGIQHYEEVSHTHSSLMPIHQAGMDEQAGFFYYVMELADNSDGSRADDAPHYQAKTLELVLGTGASRLRRSPADCVRIGMELATGLDQLHRSGLVHRDIKPANIIFVRDVAKLADIGLVTESGRAMTFVGTEGFIAPEGPGLPAADLYALGKVLYEMATGRDRLDYPSLPGMDALPESEKAQLRQLNAVILKACAPSPEQRHASALALREELDRVRVGQSIERVRTIERRVGQLKRAAVWIGVVAMMGLLTAAWQWQRLARYKLQARERLLLEAKVLGGDGRKSGWTTNSLGIIKEVKRLQSGSDVRDAAAMTLGGMEARLIFGESNAAASSIAWHPSGQELVVGGYADGSVQTSTRVISLRETADVRTSTTNVGPVAWMNGQPVQLWRGHIHSNDSDAFRVQRIRDQMPVSNVRIPPQTRSEPLLCAISADGTWSAGAIRDGDLVRVVVWDTAKGLVLGQTNISPTAMEFTPDGRFLAIGLPRGWVRVFEAATLREIGTFRAEDTSITALAFQRDVTRTTNTQINSGWRLAAGDSGSVIHVWELFGQRLIARLRGSYFEIRALAFNPDGTLLASGGRGHGRIWDVANERQLLELDFHMDFLQALAFSPDGTRLAGGNRKVWQPVYTWVMELSPHRGVQSLHGLNNRIEHIWLSGDGRFIAALSHNWQLAVWEISNGRLLHLFTGLEGSLTDNSSAAFHPNGRLYFSSGRTVRTWDLATGQEAALIILDDGLCDKFRVAPDGRLLLVRCEPINGEANRSWVLRDVLAPVPASPLHRQTDTSWTAYSCDIAPDAETVFVTGHSGVSSNRQELLVAYNTATGRERWRTNRPAVFGYTVPRFSADGRAIAFSANGQTNAWLALTNGCPIDAGPDDFVSDRFIVTAPKPGVTLTRRDDLSDSLLLGSQYGEVGKFAFSEDGRLLAWGTSQGLVVVCHLDEVQAQLKKFHPSW